MKNIRTLAACTLVISILAIAAQVMAAGGHGAEAGHHGIDWIYVGSLLFNFIVVVVLLVILLRKPVASYFSERSKQVVNALEAADRAREAAEQKIKEYDRKIGELMDTREEVLETARKEADYEKERIMDAARRQVERMIKDAERSVSFELEKAKMQLGREAVRQIAAEAEAALAKAITGDDDIRLADDYAKMLKEVKRA